MEFIIQIITIFCGSLYLKFLIVFFKTIANVQREL